MIKGIIKFFQSGLIFQPWSLIGILFAVTIIHNSEEDTLFKDATNIRIYLIILLIFTILRLMIWLLFQRAGRQYISDMFSKIVKNFVASVVVFWCVISFYLMISL